MYPHRIRLCGPWECEPLIRRARRAGEQRETQALPPPCRMTMPCRWGEGGLRDFGGRVRYRRRFGIPRQIDAHERIWLTFAGVDDSADVWLNGQFLGREKGAQGAFEFEVTALLRDRNELVVEVEASDDKGGLWGEVALEIRCAASLRSVRIRAVTSGETARLHVDGAVVGSSDRPLEIYVILDRSTVAYAIVEANLAGRPFEVISDELTWERLRTAQDASGPHEVRVELVNGATVWFTVEQSVECPDAGS